MKAPKWRRVVLLGVALAGSSFAFATGATAAPVNDAFSSAEPISGLPASIPSSNIGATVEAGEPETCSGCGVAASASVWYRYTSPVLQYVVADVCDADFDANLGVFRGEAIGKLRPIRDGRSCSSGTGSRTAFEAEAGRTYRLRVASSAEDSDNQGSYTLQLAALPITPAELACRQAAAGRPTVMRERFLRPAPSNIVVFTIGLPPIGDACPYLTRRVEIAYERRFRAKGRWETAGIVLKGGNTKALRGDMNRGGRVRFRFRALRYCHFTNPPARKPGLSDDRGGTDIYRRFNSLSFLSVRFIVHDTRIGETVEYEEYRSKYRRLCRPTG